MVIQQRQQSNNRFRRDAWLEINLSCLEYNIQKIHAKFAKPILPVLKADAYGHGAALLAQVLDSYNFIYAYGVASIDEALSLRETSSTRIIVLGLSPEWLFERALQANIDLTLVDFEMIQMLQDKASKLNTIANIHIKLDTGMNRIGFKLDRNNFHNLITQIERLPNIKIQSIFSHFVDPANITLSQRQQEIFYTLTHDLPYLKHPGSSTAFQYLQDYDIVRTGIELYGLNNPEYKPLSSLFARISFIKDIQKGESVSYGATWQASKASRIGTLPLGYADGIPRALSNRMQAYCKGNFIQQVGTITMDQMMFDLSDQANIKVGDVVELIGPHISIDDWVSKLNTISYELICNFNLRLPKSYTRN